jgi:hypothetical protein
MLAGRPSGRNPQIAFKPERKIALISTFSAVDRLLAPATGRTGLLLGCRDLRRPPLRIAGIAEMLGPFADWTPAPSHALLARQSQHGTECRGTNC